MNTVTPENVIVRIRATDPVDYSKPVEHLVAELDQAAEALMEELASFTARGVSEAFCKTAPIIRDEVKRSESVWSNSRGGTPQQKEAWKNAYPEVLELRDTFVDSLEILLIDNPDAMRTIAEINEGDGPENNLLDLSKAVELARRYPVQAKAAGYSEESVSEIALKAKEYSTVYAKTLALPGGSIPAKQDRDRARTFAEHYLSRVRFLADRVFRGQPEKRAKFTSKYQAKKNREYYLSAKAKKEADAE